MDVPVAQMLSRVWMLWRLDVQVAQTLLCLTTGCGRTAEGFYFALLCLAVPSAV